MAGAPIKLDHTPREWTTGLCSCFDDWKSCCLTCWCPCVTFGRIAHITDKGITSCCGNASLCCLICCVLGTQWMYTCKYRTKLRMQFRLREEPCCDCCLHIFCESCSLCQMYRELQNRGFNMSVGYSENMERRAQASMHPPQTQGAMIRNPKNSNMTVNVTVEENTCENTTETADMDTDDLGAV